MYTTFNFPLLLYMSNVNIDNTKHTNTGYTINCYDTAECVCVPAQQ